MLQNNKHEIIFCKNDTSKPELLRITNKQGTTTTYQVSASPLGTGCNATVWKATNNNGQSLAVKVYTQQDQKIRQEAQREAKIYQELYNQGVCMPYCPTDSKKESIAIIIPCFEGTTVTKKVEELALNGNFIELLYVMKNITCAYIKLHQNSILHFDVKPNNIIIDKNLNCHLIDFGFNSIEIENDNLRNDIKKYKREDKSNNNESIKIEQSLQEIQRRLDDVKGKYEKYKTKEIRLITIGLCIGLIGLYIQDQTDNPSKTDPLPEINDQILNIEEYMLGFPFDDESYQPTDLSSFLENIILSIEMLKEMFVKNIRSEQDPNTKLFKVSVLQLYQQRILSPPDNDDRSIPLNYVKNLLKQVKPRSEFINKLKKVYTISSNADKKKLPIDILMALIKKRNTRVSLTWNVYGSRYRSSGVITDNGIICHLLLKAGYNMQDIEKLSQQYQFSVPKELKNLMKNNETSSNMSHEMIGPVEEAITMNLDRYIKRIETREHQYKYRYMNFFQSPAHSKDNKLLVAKLVKCMVEDDTATLKELVENNENTMKDHVEFFRFSGLFHKAVSDGELGSIFKILPSSHHQKINECIENWTQLLTENKAGDNQNTSQSRPY